MGEIILWTGAGMAILGLCGVLWCLVQAVRLRQASRQGIDPAPDLRRLVAWNMGSVAFAFLGLGVIVLGMAL